MTTKKNYAKMSYKLKQEAPKGAPEVKKEDKKMKYKFNGRIYKNKKACYRAAAVYAVGVVMTIVGSLAALYLLYIVLYGAGYR